MRDAEREREREADTGRGRSRLHAGSPRRAWILGLLLKAGTKPLGYRSCPSPTFLNLCAGRQASFSNYVYNV